jgi:predicted GNAT family acetyltransferase
MTLDIRHDPDRHCFEALVDGHRNVADYRLAGGVMRITHTGVAPALRGQGIAAALVRAALEHARAAGLKVDPQCSYAAAYMRRHPETLDLLA